MRDVGKRNKKKVNKYIPIIKGEIDRNLTLMDDYLEYTKIKINSEEKYASSIRH